MSKDPAHPRQPSVSEELLALAQEAGRVGVFEWQVQTGTLHLSERFLAIYGLTDFDGRYESWLECVYREDHVRINDILESVFARRPTAVRRRVPHRSSKRSSDRLDQKSRAVVFYDEEGRAVRVVGVNVDITERKRSLAQMQAFTESLEEAVRERTRELEATERGSFQSGGAAPAIAEDGSAWAANGWDRA